MSKLFGSRPRLRGLRAHLYMLIALWTATVGGMMMLDLSQIKKGTNRIADVVAQTHFDKDQAVRLWAASHGGVYVPVNDKTQPSPYLRHVSERDLQTPSGVKLTLMNPAYMLRQIHEDFDQLFKVYGHITSLKPMRPENRPDAWEKRALAEFHAGRSQARELVEVDGQWYLRYMRPMVAQKSCLKCHDDIAKVGDMRGGVGLIVDLEPYLEIERAEIATVALTHGSVLVIGIIGLVLGVGRLERRDKQLGLAHEALLASEEKYHTLFDDSRDGVFISSRDGKVLEANPSLLQLFGYAREELLALGIRDIYENLEDRAKLREALERSGSIADYPVRVRNKGGTPMDCLISATVRRGSDGSVLGYQGIIRDITDQKRSREALERQATELARSNSELEGFAYVASHDLQEPLRNVVNTVQLLELKYRDKLGAEADSLLKYSVQSAFRMKQLIDDLLAYSRVGSRRSSFAEVECEAVLESALGNLRTMIVESSAVITHDPLPTISADPTQLEQLFQNLLSNAIKFRAEAAPEIHVSASRQDSSWLFAIKDNGIGMEQEHLARVFEMFRRLHSTKQYEGTGLGLAIAKKVVERHGGRIWAESQPGQGATFYFNIPDRAERPPLDEQGMSHEDTKSQRGPNSG
jgi:chemotaxis family two-component system sensor kinase Cph1